MPTRERRAKQLGVPVEQLPDGRGKGPKASGPAHYRWNSGRMLSDDGYVKIRVGADHPLADPNGYAYEHLVVWCAAGRARPGSADTLHHRDEDKTNNRLDNLELLTRAEHNRRHNAERERDALGRLVGKKAAGRLLDGVEHNAFPAPQIASHTARPDVQDPIAAPQEQ